MVHSRAAGAGVWPSPAIGVACGFGTCLSFPIGALLAIWYTPQLHKARRKPAHVAELEAGLMGKYAIAGMLAFGAGLLLFAVTVEMYGEAVWELQESELHGMLRMPVLNIFCTIIFALIGAAGYIALNRELRLWMASIHEAEEADPVRPTESTPLVSTPIGDDDASGCSSVAVGFFRSSSFADLVKANFLVGMEAWFGVFVSGIPEGILLGAYAAEQRLSMVFVISLFASNLPTALSSAALLRQGGRSNAEILGLWTLAMVFTAVLAGATPVVHSMFADSLGKELIARAVEGLAGGSMLACICAVMLPEAYSVQGDIAGLVTVVGFLAALVMKVFGGLVDTVFAKVPLFDEAAADMGMDAHPAGPQDALPRAVLLTAAPACTHLLSRFLHRCS